MSEHFWETIDAIYKTLFKQGRRIEELEQRVAALEVHLSELRHKGSVAEVDELYEQAQSEAA